MTSVTQGDHLRDALVADAERSLERDGSEDGCDDRIDQAGTQTDLHRPRHRAVDRQCVPVAPAGDKRPHDRVARPLQAGWSFSRHSR